ADRRTAALQAIARTVVEKREEVLATNAADVEAARKSGLAKAMIDRLTLDPKRLEQIAAAILEIAALSDPIGETVREWTRPNGLQVARRRIPLGVIAIIYESRPNVTTDAAALCLRAGNAVILRGGSEAFRSNQALAGCIARGLTESGLPAAAVQL